jgi:hypothetical protein
LEYENLPAFFEKNSIKWSPLLLKVCLHPPSRLAEI